VGFQHRSDAERFLEELRQRLQKFGLELHPQKTRIIESGRHAERKRKAGNLGKPETFVPNTAALMHAYCTRRR
jgi:RNA-directed DNA polymerase